MIVSNIVASATRTGTQSSENVFDLNQWNHAAETTMERPTGFGSADLVIAREQPETQTFSDH
jgi:hypothetical protein